jgi:integrase
MLNRYWMPHLATMPLKDITGVIVDRAIAECTFRSDNSRVEVISQLSRVFNRAIVLKLTDHNPADVLIRPALTRREIDPFNAEETEQLLAYLYADPDLHLFAAYFELAFFTGMRPAEIAALRWDEINLNKRAARVCRIVADGKVAERVKNKKPRFVLLNDRALHALAEARRLEADRARRELRFAHTPFVFPDPRDTGDYIPRSQITDRVFQLALAQCGIRERPQYNCRHTYASRCLMAGMNPGFMAKQLGHKEKVMFERYATWIEGNADWQEMAKLFGAIEQPEKSEIGTKVVQQKTTLDLDARARASAATLEINGTI